MVGHDAPSDQPIALIVEIQQSLFHDARDALIPEPAGAVARILILGDEFPQQDLPGIGGRESLDPGQFFLPDLNHGNGYSVIQTEAERLHESGTIEVRDISTRTPPRIMLSLGPPASRRPCRSLKLPAFRQLIQESRRGRRRSQGKRDPVRLGRVSGRLERHRCSFFRLYHFFVRRHRTPTSPGEDDDLRGPPAIKS